VCTSNCSGICCRFRISHWAGAQSTFGGIVGTEKEPGQGAIANAQLTLTNVDDHTQRDSATDGNGGLQFISLRPGHYELIIRADGFADYKMTALQLEARQTTESRQRGRRRSDRLQSRNHLRNAGSEPFRSRGESWQRFANATSPSFDFCSLRPAGVQQPQILSPYGDRTRSGLGWLVYQHSLFVGNRSVPYTDHEPSYDPGNLNLSYRGSFQRPDCIGNGDIANPARRSMFDINAFNPIPAGPVGNCAVSGLEGPGTTTIAAGLSKTFHLSERFRMRFEDTFTNLLNHPNFAPPPTNVTSSSFGIVQSVAGRGKQWQSHRPIVPAVGFLNFENKSPPAASGGLFRA
jgi:Carboxypeptidase regulatory-like domain